MRFEISELNPAADTALKGGRWPWNVIGVFPVEGTEMPNEWWNRFCYTVGAPMPAEVWAACCSIEGRCMDFELTTHILNRLAAGYIFGPLNDGDEVVVPLGVANQEDAEDVESIWWIGSPDTREHRSTYQSDKPYCIPVLWSSPLGWSE